MLSVSFGLPVLTGIAVFPSNLHLVQLKKCKKGYAILRVRRYELPAAIYSEGKITAFQQLQKFLVDIVRQEELTAAKTVLSVGLNQVKMNQITVPAGLSDADIEAEICTHVYRSLPAKAEPLAIDFYMKSAAKVEDVNVVFAAARKDYIERYHACVQAAGLKVVSIDVDVFALLRAVRYALRDNLTDAGKCCCVYLNDDYALMIILQNNEIIFYQQWDGADNSRLSVTQLQWLEWCCHHCKMTDIKCAAVGGNHELIYAAVKIISARWTCKIFEPDPFLAMPGASIADKNAIQNSPSIFLLACGLAMREVPVW
ncbi:MAG TPA: pilus assembly protein PilM [Gammaproteobacteria bacterium]|jgi:Tfp pilus assembly PilM family ATPase|nr:pilus assembly protein PilM [Gammaproteobacteria bacterium]